MMDLYNITATETSRWGTRPQIMGHGFGALDLMELISSPDGVQDLAITDAAGNSVSIGHVIADARAAATTPEALEHWASQLARAVFDQLGFDSHVPAREITEDDWRQAGRWWAEHVGAAPEPIVLTALRDRLYSRDPTHIERGVQQFVAFATPVRASRLRGTLTASSPTPPSPRPSRVRGTAATAAASPPGTRHGTGGASAGQAGPHINPSGRARS
jgi:hypothetical protein